MQAQFSNADESAVELTHPAAAESFPAEIAEADALNQGTSVANDSPNAVQVCRDQSLPDAFSPEPQKAFIDSLALRTRGLSDPDVVAWETVRALGEYTRASRCTFVSVDDEAGTVEVTRDWTREDVPSAVGTYPAQSFGPGVLAVFRSGRPFVCTDIYADDRLGPEQWTTYEALKIRSHASVPIHRGSVWVGVLTLNDTIPRDWTIEELALLGAVAEHAWLAADYARLIKTLEERELELATAYRRALCLNRIGLSARLLDDPERVQQTAVDAVAEELGADRCTTIIVDYERDFMKFVAEWKRPDLRSHLGEFRYSSFNTTAQDIFSTTEPAAIPDVYQEAWSRNVLDVLDAMKIKALLLVPMYADGQVVSLIAVYMSDAPRNWTPDEISFVEAVAAQVRSSMEASRMLAEAKARAEREALINQIGRAVRAHADPLSIQAAVAEILGLSLALDRCVYATYDSVRDRVDCLHDWHRPDLSTVSGSYRYTDLVPVLSALFSECATAVINDVEDGPSEMVANTFRRYSISSAIAVPLYDADELVAALYIGMADDPRIWTKDEVIIAEQAATLTRTAIDSARASLREQAIATKLQRALQPAIDADVTGLDLKEYYRPALDESSIGGDFFDVFGLGESAYAIVVGDLSGKGLAAAAQVSTLRNMLRYALYTSPSVEHAVLRLNTTIIDRGLLMGFATVFVARYDSVLRELTYVNCGQEPALVARRDSGVAPTPNGEVRVQLLMPTFPVLGTDSDAIPKEKRLTLAQGDALVVFTDGMTEIGPDRSDQLGIQRLTDLVSRGSAESAGAMVDRIVEGLGAHSPLYNTDDQCLLVGIVT